MPDFRTPPPPLSTAVTNFLYPPPAGRPKSAYPPPPSETVSLVLSVFKMHSHKKLQIIENGAYICLGGIQADFDFRLF